MCEADLHVVDVVLGGVVVPLALVEVAVAARGVLSSLLGAHGGDEDADDTEGSGEDLEGKAVGEAVVNAGGVAELPGVRDDHGEGSSGSGGGTGVHDEGTVVKSRDAGEVSNEGEDYSDNGESEGHSRGDHGTVDPLVTGGIVANNVNRSTVARANVPPNTTKGNDRACHVKHGQAVGELSVSTHFV